MPAVDYYAIETGLKARLDADATLTGLCTTVIEEDFSWSQADGPVVYIYMDRREPHSQQTMNAGQRTRFLVHLSVWVRALSMDGFKQASGIRDTLLGKVEAALMRDRTLGGAAGTSWLEGGEMLSAKATGAELYLSAAEIKLVVDVLSATT